MSHSVTLTQLDQMAILDMLADQDSALAEANRAKAYQNGINKADETIRALAKKLGDMQTACDQERARHQEAEEISAKKEIALNKRIIALEAQTKQLEEERDKLSDDFYLLREAAKGQGMLSPPKLLITYEKLLEDNSPFTARHEAAHHQKVYDMHKAIYDAFQQID